MNLGRCYQIWPLTKISCCVFPPGARTHIPTSESNRSMGPVCVVPSFDLLVGESEGSQNVNGWWLWTQRRDRKMTFSGEKRNGNTRTWKMKCETIFVFVVHFVLVLDLMMAEEKKILFFFFFFFFSLYALWMPFWRLALNLTHNLSICWWVSPSEFVCMWVRDASVRGISWWSPTRLDSFFYRCYYLLLLLLWYANGWTDTALKCRKRK